MLVYQLEEGEIYSRGQSGQTDHVALHKPYPHEAASSSTREFLPEVLIFVGMYLKICAGLYGAVRIRLLIQIPYETFLAHAVLLVLHFEVWKVVLNLAEIVEYC